MHQLISLSSNVPDNFKAKLYLLSKSFIQLEKYNKDKMEMNVLQF